MVDRYVWNVSIHEMTYGDGGQTHKFMSRNNVDRNANGMS